MTPSLIEPTELRAARVADVALLRPIDKPYSYLVPDELISVVQPGMRVSVPFGRGYKPTPGFVLSLSEEPWSSTLKPIIAPIDAAPLMGSALLELGRWMASYYAAPLGRTLDLMVPSAAKRGAGRRRVVYVVGVEPAATEIVRTKKQQALIDSIGTVALPARMDVLAAQLDCTTASLKALEKKGLLRLEMRMELAPPAAGGQTHPEPTFELNDDQKNAIAEISSAIDANEFAVPVLFGVTGSGKTEVYIAAIRRALALGRQAIMLVPEIALTTQTVRRMQQRFERVATIHSGMSETERSRTWAAVASGEIPVVIGTRSAVFAPCPNLGLIIVDEEAEPSYKSQAAPRYHTRDTAVKRGQIESIPVVLGSATPSLETWLNVQRRKHYKLLRLPRRVRGLAMPTMQLVDMKEEHLARPGVHMLSRAMEKGLEETLARGEQAVVLLNRRGYASFLHCAKCRTVISCPHCSVHLVFHTSTQMGHCHYCNRKLQVPSKCQNLGCDGTIVKFGLGTQRVEEEMFKRFPAARVRRIDSDVMETAADYADLLGAFERKEFDILVGTQMVAKGLDFPFVSFVGVVSADTSLALDDFRSEERTFQLVLQVAGRSGRADTGGMVVVQTFAADTAPIRHAVKGDYEGFAKQELARRRETDLPPWTRMVRTVLADGHITKARKAAEDVARRTKELLGRHSIEVSVLEPHPSAIARLRDQYRFDVLMVFKTADALQRGVAVMKDEGVLRPRVKSVMVDVDPVSLQ